MSGASSSVAATVTDSTRSRVARNDKNHFHLPQVLQDQVLLAVTAAHAIRKSCSDCLSLSTATERHASLIAALDTDREAYAEAPLEHGGDLLKPIADDLLRIGSTTFDPTTFGSQWAHIDPDSPPPMESTGKAGGKRKRSGSDPPVSTTFVYLRSWVFPSVASLESYTRAYGESHDGEKVWAEALTRTLHPVGDESGSVRLFYAGVTRRDPLSRHEEDANDEHRRRVVNFTLSPPPGFTPPVFEGIWYYAFPASAAPLAACDAEQDVERALVSVLSPGLNVARGGMRVSFRSASKERAAWLDDLDNEHPGIVHVKDSIKTLLNDSVRLLRLDGQSLPTPVATENILADAVALAAVTGTTPVTISSLALTSDIPAYAHQAQSSEYSFAGQFTGQGPHTLLRLRAVSLGIDGTEGEEHFAKWFGPRVDLWQFIEQCDREPWKQLLLLARYILTLKPVLVRAYSAHVARYIFNGALTGMFTAGGSSDMGAFFSGSFQGEWDEVAGFVHPDYLALAHSPAVANMSAKIGRPVAIQVGPPSQNFWVICICNYDPGCLKYDPAKTRVALSLLQAVENINAAAEGIIIGYTKENGPPPTANNYEWVVGCRAAIVEFLESNNFTSALDSAVDEYDRLSEALGDARGKTSDATTSKTSEMMSHARPEGTKLHVLADGLTYSAERNDQADRIRAFVAQAEDTGMVVPHCLPMFDRHSVQQARQWILSKPTGYNFTLAAQASNSHVTRSMTFSERKTYALDRFAAYNQARREREWRCAIDAEGTRLDTGLAAHCAVVRQMQRSRSRHDRERRTLLPPERAALPEGSQDGTV